MIAYSLPSGQRARSGGGKELAGLDEHQVRSWTSWHRWTILALLARAFLCVLAQPRHPLATSPPGHRPSLPLPAANPDNYVITKCRPED